MRRGQMTEIVSYYVQTNKLDETHSHSGGGSRMHRLLNFIFEFLLCSSLQVMMDHARKLLS